MMHASDMHDCHMMQQRHDSHSACILIHNTGQLMQGAS